MSSATGNDGYTSRYFSVTNTGLENGSTAGHNAYFDVPFADSVAISITGDTAWAAFYNIFYEIGRRLSGRYSEFFARSPATVSLPMPTSTIPCWC